MKWSRQNPRVRRHVASSCRLKFSHAPPFTRSRLEILSLALTGPITDFRTTVHEYILVSTSFKMKMSVSNTRSRYAIGCLVVRAKFFEITRIISFTDRKLYNINTPYTVRNLFRIIFVKHREFLPRKLR